LSTHPLFDVPNFAQSKIKIQSKMKKNLLIAFVAGSLTLASCGEKKTETAAPKAPETPLTGDATLAIDVASSKVIWQGNMTGIKIYSHEGTVNIADGTVTLKDGKVTGGSFTIDMNSIKPTDTNYTEEQGHTAADLVGHLMSPDFFDIANNPTASFAITGANGSTATGNLTLRGKTNPENIEITNVSLDGENVKLAGKITFDRQKYGVAFAMPVKDLALSNDIVLNVELVGKKKA
jgi:polyisoprenoid-binding protein YceI